jgi:hypothetical protein
MRKWTRRKPSRRARPAPRSQSRQRCSFRSGVKAARRLDDACCAASTLNRACIRPPPCRQSGSNNGAHHRPCSAAGPAALGWVRPLDNVLNRSTRPRTDRSSARTGSSARPFGSVHVG